MKMDRYAFQFYIRSSSQLFCTSGYLPLYMELGNINTRIFEVLRSRNWTYYNHIGLTYFVIVFTVISSLLLFVLCRMLVLPNGFELETAGIDSYSIRPGTRRKC